MTKLEDFRLESYNERQAVLTALMLFKQQRPFDPYALIEAADLIARLVKVECQTGGCSICNPEGATND
jgi:hypothetical protein